MTVLLEILGKAGFVGPPLVLAAAVLWYALGRRWYLLRAPSPATPDHLLKASDEGTVLGAAVTEARRARRRGLATASALEVTTRPLREHLGSHTAVIRGIVAVAPLAGLLGTVTGMIETFDSLGSMQLFSRGGGIGGGISEAMVSTQLGLVVAVPGLLAGALLDRRQHALEDALDAVLERLVREEAP